LASANKFWIALFVLILLYGLNLCAPVSAFDWQRGECPACESSFIDNWEYPQDWELLWDPANPEEIGENSSVNISVIGGVSPYQWSVSGTGFWLSSDQTEGLSNTLNADDIACGSAEIKVTDGFGDIVIGYVRCLSGKWVSLGNDCDYPGDGTYTWTGFYTFYRIVGKYKQLTDYWLRASGAGACGYNVLGDSPPCDIECVYFDCSIFGAGHEKTCRSGDVYCYHTAGCPAGKADAYDWMKTSGHVLYEWVCP
jgi:hypothetical protein